ncbi:MAG: hypothetical protein HKN39_03420 [Flavobacteriales bacterium]|nr:hypothetical protein [Flavobacteriales bacterium]
MKTKITTKTLLALSTLALTLTFSSCTKQQGCMDPMALNYDEGAEQDCCCAYINDNIGLDENKVVSGNIISSTTWTNNNIYELAGKVIVENGATLTIEEGTIVKGRTGTGSLASALVIAKGSKIIAEGTESRPIIFTSVLDNIERGELTGTNLNEEDNAKWGGLIILGNAPISAENGDSSSQIEGIPADEEYGRYGGNDPADNSGILTYVSVRHGGALIGEGNEINGITLGGVGNGTTMHHIEVVANLDDGIECFGGTVIIDNAIVGFQGDDGIDLDQNYSGTINNFAVIHGIDTDEALEIDGPEGSLTDGLFTLSNGLIISTDGTGSAMDLKSGAQGTIEAVSIWGYDSGSVIKLRCSFEEDCATDKEDAYTHYVNNTSTLSIINSEFGENSLGNSISIYTKSTDGSGIACPIPINFQLTGESVLSANGNIFNASSPSVGADLTEFNNWSWSAIHGKF